MTQEGHFWKVPEAERCVIGSLLFAATNEDDECAVTVFGSLDEGDFNDPTWRQAFAAAKRLHDRGERCERTLLVHGLAHDMPRLDATSMLYEASEAVATSATVGSYIERIQEASRQQQMYCAGVDFVNAIRTAKHPEQLNVAAEDLRTTLDGVDRADRSRPATELAIPPYVPFPVDSLPRSVREYIGAASAAIGCDPSFIALPLLASLARAIGNKRVIGLKRTWTEPSIIWAAIIGKSGSHKTPAMKLALEFLQRRQSEAFSEYDSAMVRYEQHKACFDRDYQAWKVSKKGTEPPPTPPQQPDCERFTTTDTTIEALATLLHSQVDGVLVERDELAGWLGGMAEYKASKGSDVGHWLACWSANSLTIDRKTGSQKTMHVPRASVSIVGGIQPGIFRNAIGREHMQDGLCARLLMAMPDPRPAHWTDAVVEEPVEDSLSQVFEALLSLEPDFDDDECPVPRAMPLTCDAQQIWVAHQNRYGTEQVGLGDDLAAAWSKLVSYTARLALICQLCSWADGEADGEVVDEVNMQRGIDLADWFGYEARRVYGLFGESQQDRKQRELVELVQRKGGSVVGRDLMCSARSRYRNSDDAESALQGLVDAGLGKWEHVPSGPRGGRPTRRFQLFDRQTGENSHEPTANGRVHANGRPQSDGFPNADSAHRGVNGHSATSTGQGEERAAFEEFEAERRKLYRVRSSMRHSDSVDL